MAEQRTALRFDDTLQAGHRNWIPNPDRVLELARHPMVERNQRPEPIPRSRTLSVSLSIDHETEATISVPAGRGCNMTRVHNYVTRYPDCDTLRR